MKPARSCYVEVRGQRHHLLEWGPPDAPPVFFVHGWMDVGASFQFLIDAFRRDWHCIAPDLRGFGRSEWQPQGYWYFDYIADLEVLLDRYAPDGQVDLVGHSLGGNIVMHYAGVRPARVRRLVSLDGFGIPLQSVDAAAPKIAKWLDALRDPPAWKPYRGMAGVADRLQKNNPRLTRERALFLASYWAREDADGSATLASDPRHKLPFPTVYRMEEVTAVWRRITAPTLWVAAAESHVYQWLDPHPEGEIGHHALAGIRKRMTHIAGLRLEVLDGAGHMLHHDRPDAVAALVEPFLAGP